MAAIDFSSDLGLAAIFLLSLNLLLGLLISVRYDPMRSWPRRRIDVFAWHNWTGYLALAVTVAHPLPLAWSARLRFTWGQIAWPIHAPSQPGANLVGAVALYLLALVVLTSTFRVALGRTNWKRLHYLAYVSAALCFVHGLLLDPELHGRPVDWLDGEKVAIELCLAVVVVASLARWRFAQRHPERFRVTPRLPYNPWAT